MISTQRTVVKQLSEKDIPAILEMYAEPESNKYIAPLIAKSKEEFIVILKNKINANQKEVGF